MKKTIFLILALVVTTLSFSQRNPNGTYLSSFVYEAKDGMRDKFESAAAKKTNMFNSEEGNLIWTYRVMTGQNAGQYVRFLINQSSSDYGEDKSKELAYWEKNVSPYARQISGMQNWVLIEPMNIGDDAPAAKYLERQIFTIRPGMQDAVWRYLWRAGKTLEKVYPDGALRRVFRLISGGNPNVVASFRAFNDYPHWGNGDIEFEDAYNEEFGWRQHEADLKAFNESIREWGENVTTLQRVDNMMPN